jgi:hypothetical protein
MRDVKTLEKLACGIHRIQTLDFGMGRSEISRHYM